MLAVGKARLTNLLDLLGIISSQTDKDKHTDIGSDPVNHFTFKKNIDHRRNNDTDQSHKQETAEAGHIALGNITVKAHCAKGSCRHQKCADDRTAGINQKNCRKRHPV